MNNKKLARLLEPNTKLFVICMALFAVLSFSVDRPLGLLQAAVTAMVFFYARSVNNKRKQNVLQYIDSVTGSVDSASKSTLVNSPPAHHGLSARCRRDHLVQRGLFAAGRSPGASF